MARRRVLEGHSLVVVEQRGIHADAEKVIVEAFNIVFNQKNIGLFDDFLRLGGDSIIAIRVISLLEKNNISCNARDILDYKTPYLIAQNVEKSAKISYPATEGQIDLMPIQNYFFDQINSDDFTQDFILKSKVNLDLNILQNAFNELTNIHDMLRAKYKIDNENIIQHKTMLFQIGYHGITDRRLDEAVVSKETGVFRGQNGIFQKMRNLLIRAE